MTIERRTFELLDDTEPDRIIRGRIESPAGAEERGEPLPAVLVLHGFKGFMNWGFFPELSRRIAAEGFVALSFNMSGSGVGEDLENFTDDEAFEKNTPSRELEDADAIRGFVQSGALPWVDPTRLAILGHSLGGGVALLHAAEHGDLCAVVTWAAVSRVNRYDPSVVEGWRHEGFLPIPNARTGQVHRLGTCWLEDVEEHAAELDIVQACARLQTPTLLVHGTADDAVPQGEAETLRSAFAPGVARSLLLEGAGHTFGATHPPEGVPDDLGRALEETLAHLRAHLA